MARKTNMTYRTLGNCGTRVSTFGLGGWTTYGGSIKDAKTVSTIIRRAFEAGVNFFDIADIYANGESETAMGRVLKEFPRHELVITSKVFWPMSDDVNDKGLSRKHIMESVNKSLKRIGTDYLDIYFCHRFDPETPLEETARAMDDLVHQGKILYWGTSEWTGKEIRDVQKICNDRNLYAPQVEQPQYSLLERDKFENSVRPEVKKSGMGCVVWSPLASGFLSGKYDKGVPKGSRLDQIDWLRDAVINDERTRKVKKMKEFADELGVSRAQLALAWCAAQPGVTSVITGATKLTQLEENLGALRVEISPAISSKLSKLFS